MKMIIKQKVYQMNRKQYRETLKVASRCVKNGIYAIEKGEIGELKNEVYKSADELKKSVRGYEKQGFKVYYKGA